MGRTFSKFDDPLPSETGGFRMRDVVRFFVVDIIVTASLRLLELIGFFRSIDGHVGAILFSKVLIFLYLVWLIRDRREAWPETGAATPGKWWSWPLALAVYAAGYYVVAFFDGVNIGIMTRLHAALGLVYEHRPQTVMVLMFEDILTPWVRGALVFAVVFAGPVLEELAFRGMMLDAYRRRHGVVWSVAATGALFGAYHFSLSFLLPLSVLGILFGVVRVLCRTLWCSVLAHCLHNALTLFLVARNLGVPPF